ESADQFAFRHALTQQAVYGELLARERRALHGTIAAMIAHLYGDSLDTHLADLAYHAYEAGAWEQALDYSRRVGERGGGWERKRRPRRRASHVRRDLHRLRPLPAGARAGACRRRTARHRLRGRGRGEPALPGRLLRRDYVRRRRDVRAGSGARRG